MNETKIRWSTHSWNPVHGCSKVSAGCANCYAERISLKFGQTKKPWSARFAEENVLLKPHKIRDPYKIKDPARVFVNSMSDLFHSQIPDWYRALVFSVMIDLDRHQFLVLTKRPGRAGNWLGRWPVAIRHPKFAELTQKYNLPAPMFQPASPWAPNIWMGTSVENAAATYRIGELREIPAAIRFISFEPLIGPIGEGIDLRGIHWAIVGGESGQDPRPMPHAWARAIRDACLFHGTAFYFKQSTAYRTELGQALLHNDGSFWRWEQYPDQVDKEGEYAEPWPGEPHRFTCE